MRAVFPALLASLLLSACGGGSAVAPDAPPPIVQPPDPPPVQPDFSAVGAEVERFDVADVTLIIGDASGELYRYEKGNVRADTQLNIASASKLYTGLAVWSLVETGELSLDMRPQDVIPQWTSDPNDPRSRITVEQLLSFRSGFNARPSGDSCPGVAGYSLQACIREIYEGGVETEPGSTFSYGPEHMQVAALMAREATGKELSEIMRTDVWDAAGVSETTTFPSELDNVRYSAGIRSTAADYGRVLRALLAGELVSDLGGFLSDRTDGVPSAYTLPSLRDSGLDWHYGFGFWLECDAVPFAAECADTPIISSPGAFGFTPWVDFDTGYWAVLAMQEPLSTTPSPARTATEFAQVLQPMIEAEF